MSDVLRYRALVRNLVLKDLKLKYRDSLLGVAWSLLHPVLMLGVYTLAFKLILRLHTENYTYFLIVGLLPWTFFSSALVASTQAIIGSADLIKKVSFPREALPIATVLFAFAQLLLSLAVLLPAAVLLSDVGLRWTATLLPPLLVLHLLFTLGLAFLLSATTVFFRDVAHLTEVALPLVFWITPIVYPVALAPPLLQTFFQISPMAAFVLAYQDVLVWGRVPPGLVMVTLVGWTAAALAAGCTIFSHRRPSFAEEV